MPSKPLMKFAKKKNSNQFNVINLKNMKICPDCLATNVQQRRENVINANLMKIIESAINTVSFQWSNKIESVNLQSATNLLSFLPYTMRNSSSFMACTSNKKICSLTVDPIVPKEEKKMYQEKIIGGKLPATFEITKVAYNTLKCPANADYGIIKFSDTNDFIIIGKLQSYMEDILSYGLTESIAIKQNITGSRSGEASGLVYPDTNSKSLCEATKKNDSILLQRKKVWGVVFTMIIKERKSHTTVFSIRFACKE